MEEVDIQDRQATGLKHYTSRTIQGVEVKKLPVGYAYGYYGQAYKDEKPEQGFLDGVKDTHLPTFFNSTFKESKTTVYNVLDKVRV